MLFIYVDHHKEIKYVVDFDPVLAEIITETKYMEQLGFSVPELARNIALQVRKNPPYYFWFISDFCIRYYKCTRMFYGTF